MTKKDLLLTLSYTRRRDSWASYGGIDYDNTYLNFNKNSFFLLNDATSPLDGHILFVTEDVNLTTPFTWNTYQLHDATTGEIIDPTLNLVHPYFFVLLTPAQIATIIDPVDITFNPFVNYDPITISDEELNMIMIELGVPFVRWDELEFTREQVLNYMIKPAMLDYFRFFPILRTESYPLYNRSFTIPIPNWATMVVRANVNQGYPLNDSPANPLLRHFDEVLMSISSRGSFANPSLNPRMPQKFNNLQGYSTFILEKAVRQGVVNYASRVRFRVENNNVVGFATKSGLLQIEWGSISNVWDDIPFNRKAEARDLARAYILQYFGQLRSQVRPGELGTIDYQNFMSRATELKTKIITLWESFPKAAIVRGN